MDPFFSYRTSGPTSSAESYQIQVAINSSGGMAKFWFFAVFLASSKVITYDNHGPPVDVWRSRIP